jgi:formylglycine-generating enzyme required for sulfatase activity
MKFGGTGPDHAPKGRLPWQRSTAVRLVGVRRRAIAGHTRAVPLRPNQKRLAAATLVVLVAVGSWLVASPTQVARCPSGLVAAGPRCCAPGQRHVDGRCEGIAESCSERQTLVNGQCVAANDQVRIPGGALELKIDDWDLNDHAMAPPAKNVPTFLIDRTEVTWGMWLRCSEVDACPALNAGDEELPVTGVRPAEAERYCLSRGGSLPTSFQWLLAASGAEGRRYPWGAFGLVCRRAVFGLEDGPCATGARGPEAPGSRPDGATPEGLLDLAGNVAEWTRDLSGEGYVARGGSYRSTLAAQLKVLGVRSGQRPAKDVGFRCVYPAHGAEETQPSGQGL